MRFAISMILAMLQLFNIGSGVHKTEYLYDDNVEHVFTHCLIAYPDIAFASDNSMRKHYDRDCITALEFSNMLISLHRNGYALINLNETFEVVRGVARRKVFYMPKGKKPLVLSFDDVVYDRKKMHKGMVDKIALDKHGRLCALTNNGTVDKLSYDNEFIPILESFISRHPDFSVRGAKGMINLTGYDGILGYRTNGESTNRQQEIQRVKPIIGKLKQNGWYFASHSYGHYHMQQRSAAQMDADSTKWNKEVASLVGKTNIYVYPYGERSVTDNGGYCQKHKVLQRHGFKLFCGVGIKPFYSNFPGTDKFKKPTLFMDRKVVDGTTLTQCKSGLAPLFDADEIYDRQGRRV